MTLTQVNRKAIWLAVPAAMTTGLVALGLNWSAAKVPANLPLSQDALLGLLKLMSAASIGFLITAIQRHSAAEPVSSRAIDQAQILLCIAGALVVMLIGDSMARAIGILGGASIVRFRTPVDDPRDATVLFLLLGLGMAAGLGHFGLAGLAAMFLGAVLLFLSGNKEQKLRSLTLQVVGSSADMPAGRIECLLKGRVAAIEPREITQGERPVIRYQVSVDPALSLGDLSQELLNDREAFIQSLSWDTPKKERFL